MKKENVIDLDALIAILQLKWKILLFVPLIFTILTFFLTFTYPNKYFSTSLLSQNSSVSGTPKNELGSIAAIAGIDINMGAQKGTISIFEIIETIKSRDFFYSLVIESNEILTFFISEYKNNEKIKTEYPNLSEVLQKKNDFNHNIDINRFLTESYYFYKEKFISISVDKESGFLTITIESNSPNFSKKALETLIALINKKIKDKTLFLSEKTILYLEDLINQESQLLSIRASLNERLFQEVGKSMLASVQDDFALVVIDSPSISYKPTKPRRVFISFSVLVGSFLFFIFFYCIDFLLNREKYEKI